MRAVDSTPPTALTVSSHISLLRVSLNLLRQDRYQVPKETTCALVGASSKVKLRSRRFIRIVTIGRRAVRETHAPDALDGQRLSRRVLDQAFKLVCIQVVSRDESSRLRGTSRCEVRNQQTMTEASEVKRSKRHSPRRVQPVAM